MYHTSVLLNESIEGLAPKPSGVYVDATFGGGGHARAILELLGPEGRLIAFDQDTDAAENCIEDPRFSFVQANFRHIRRFLRLHGFAKIDGLIADLGVSSHQLDEAERGFSYRFEAPLDMRMNRSAGITAADVLNTFPAQQLQDMFSNYGELRNAKTFAGAVVQRRAQGPLRTTAELRLLCEQYAKGDLHRYLAQVYQALRMEVNDELGALKELLLESGELIKSGGRLVVITFHSLEDRMVKNYMKHGGFGDEPEKDIFGNFERKWRLITRKPVIAGNLEARENPRSLSAKLRVAEKI